MKKIIILLTSLIIILVLPFTAFAVYDYSDGTRTTLLIDEADLIPDYDEADFLQKLEEVSSTNSCEIAILTVTSTQGQDITAFADDYFDYNGFGYGEDDDGLMLVVNMGSREYAITTHGLAIEIFTDYNLNRIENAFIPYLSDGDYTNAFTSFITECSITFDDYESYLNNGDDNNYYHEDEYYYNDDYIEIPENNKVNIFSIKWIAISVVIGIIVAFIYTGSLKAKLKTVRSKSAAQDYVVPGSLQITQQRDIFIRSDVKRTPKPKSNSSGSSGGRSSFGGGSSTHTSSSGRTHGGSRGSF